MPPPRNDNPRRKNGFSMPYTGAQLSTWVALPALIAEFVIVVAPVLPLEAAIPCTVVFGIFAALSAYYAFMAQKIDPMDEHLCKHLERQKNGQDEQPTQNNGFGGALGNPGDELEPMKYCWICETQVAEHAMHCKFCNKCVGKFDHHCLCKWPLCLFLILTIDKPSNDGSTFIIYQGSTHAWGKLTTTISS